MSDHAACMMTIAGSAMLAAAGYRPGMSNTYATLRCLALEVAGFGLGALLALVVQP